jgi:hemoglobin
MKTGGMKELWAKGFVKCAAIVLLGAFAFGATMGCGTTKKTAKKKDDFFTSGSREADQRASQRMAKAEQLSGSGEGAGEKGVKKAQAAKPGATNDVNNASKTNKAAVVEGKLALYDRLGGEKGLTAIVDDFLKRAMEDPRVNWPRNGVKRGGFSFSRGKSVTWNANTNSVAILKKHFVQFLSLATGGPAQYDGKEIKQTHASMHIANPEFDAALGDLKASLDKLQVPNKEQKELLAIIESTRPQIVTQR